MPYQIILSALALKELESAVDWYNECEQGLGERFVEAVDNHFLLLTRTPDIFPVKLSGHNES
jgi:hypothetical protein